MTTYITPTVYRYENVDKLLKSNPSSTSLEQLQLSIDDLLEKRFLCVVGEPGIGKSRLFEEFISSIKEKNKIFSCKALEFDEKQISGHIDYCIIDALDEVDNIYYTLKAINNFKRSHNSTKVLFSCRKHYVTTNISHFASCQELCYLELQN
jgi:Predicted ATPase